MFCRHVYTKLDRDRVQYCEKCGKARSVDCSHNWSEYRTMTVSSTITNAVHAYRYIRECSICGELKDFEF